MPESDKSTVRWEHDLDISIEGETWGELCKDGATSYWNSRYRIIQLNFLHQLYIKPSKLHKFNKKSHLFALDVEKVTFSLPHGPAIKFRNCGKKYLILEFGV